MNWIRRILFFGILISAAPALAELPTGIAKPELNQEAMDKLGWKLGCQAYTFRSLTLLETIDVLHDLGLHYIELYPGQKFSKEHPETKSDDSLPPERIDELMAKLKAADVTAVNYGVTHLPNDETQARKTFEFAKKLGLQTIVSEPPADAFDLLDKLAQEYQINIAIHDHPKPSAYWNPDAVLKVCEGRSNRIGACADVGHWLRSGLVPVECLTKLEGRIISSHFKDIVPSPTKEGKFDDVPFGEGKVDMKGLLGEFKRQGVKPVISIEYETGQGEELIRNVAKCIENFSKAATELAEK